MDVQDLQVVPVIFILSLGPYHIFQFKWYDRSDYTWKQGQNFITIERNVQIKLFESRNLLGMRTINKNYIQKK